MESQILRRKWGWIGHTLCKPAASDLEPQGKAEKRKSSCRHDIEAELNRNGTSWGEVEKKALSCVEWRKFVDGFAVSLC